MEKEVACSSLYYLAHGLYKIEKYDESIDEIERLLILQENYPNALVLKELCQSHVKEGFFSKLFRRKKKRVIAPPPVVMTEEEAKKHIEKERKRRLELAAKYATQGPELNEEEVEEETRQEELLRSRTLRSMRLQQRGLGDIRNSKGSGLGGLGTELFSSAQNMIQNVSGNKNDEEIKPNRPKRPPPVSLLEKTQEKTKDKKSNKIDEIKSLEEESSKPKKDKSKSKEKRRTSESKRSKRHSRIKSKSTEILEDFVAEDNKDAESQSSKVEDKPSIETETDNAVIENDNEKVDSDELNKTKTEEQKIGSIETSNKEVSADETPTSETKESLPPKRPTKPSSNILETIENMRNHEKDDKASTQPTKIDNKVESDKDIEVNEKKEPSIKAPVKGSPNKEQPPLPKTSERPSVPPKKSVLHTSNQLNNSGNKVEKEPPTSAPKKMPGKIDTSNWMKQNNAPESKPKVNDLPTQNKGISDQKKHLASLLAKGPPPMGMPGYTPKTDSSVALDEEEKLEATDKEERTVDVDENGLPTGTTDHLLQVATRAKGPKRRPPRR